MLQDMGWINLARNKKQIQDFICRGLNFRVLEIARRFSWT